MRSAWGVVVVFVAVVAACGGSTDGGTVASSSVSADQACTDNAHARCTKMQACSSAWLAMLYGDEAACETRQKESCTRALAAPGNANTPDASESCAKAIDGWACGDFLVAANPPASCGAKVGPGATASSCSAAGQCASSFCAHSTTACGACAAVPNEGDPCTPTRQCGAGRSCSGMSTCVTPAAAGAACGMTQPCAPGLRCAKGTCAQVDTVVAAGQPCGDVNGKNVECTSGTCEKGTCVARAADGAHCDLVTGPYCTPPALCIQGTCQVSACP